MSPICGFNKTRGATSHTARETIQLLHKKFPGRVLSRSGDQNWPPRSCDLTPLDFFLWGYLKSQIYVNKPTTIRALKEEIQRCIDEIQPHLCKIVVESFISTQECVCACKAVEDICLMCYSTNNPILCTL